jgi:hypothetical protein
MTAAARRSQPRQTPTGDPSSNGERAISRPRSSLRGEPPSVRRAQRSHPDLLRIINRLQPRDYVIAHLLDEHRTLTTPQIAALLFNSTATARNRLYRLRAAGWLDCFTPTRPGGRLPTHWVPGPLSAVYAAHNDGRAPASARTLRQQREAVAVSAQLEHADGANQFFIDLLAHARTHSGSRLTRWWPPTRASAATGRRIHPDGHGVWQDDGRQVGFWLEHDTGTETVGRLTDKLDPYRRLRRDGGPDYVLLFHLPSTAREANLHRRLATAVRDRPNDGVPDLGITVATCCHHEDPAGRVWKVVGNGRGRYRLADLPSHPGRPGPYHPGPPTPEQAPLHLLAATVDPLS